MAEEEEDRPIRIEVPEELNFSQEQLNALEFAFRVRLSEIVKGVPIEDKEPSSINITKPAVKVDVISPGRRRASKSASSSRKSYKDKK